MERGINRLKQHRGYATRLGELTLHFEATVQLTVSRYVKTNYRRETLVVGAQSVIGGHSAGLVHNAGLRQHRRVPDLLPA